MTPKHLSRNWWMVIIFVLAVIAFGEIARVTLKKYSVWPSISGKAQTSEARRRLLSGSR